MFAKDRAFKELGDILPPLDYAGSSTEKEISLLRGLSYADDRLIFRDISSP